ncbi:hypothetical protein AGMMS4956_03060 [Bacteroidia bacterium]|nr:hypothetical protein AGMMS4956_03060 [Bacteroidia bacterium]
MCVLWIVLTAAAAQAQDARLTNVYANPIYLNPAYTGVAEHWRGGVAYRSGWQALTTQPYRTLSLYADYGFSDGFGNLGVMAVSDRTPDGSLIHSQIGLSYAFRITLNERTFVKIGWQPQLQIFQHNAASLIYPDQIDYDGNVLQSNAGGSTVTKADMALGTVFSNGNFYMGVAIYHLLMPKQTQAGEITISTPRKYTVHLGGNLSKYSFQEHPRYNVDNTIIFSPNLLIMQQGKSNFCRVGTYIALSRFAVGFHYGTAWGTTLHFYQVGAQYTHNTIGIAYHFEFGALSSSTQIYSANTHEISFFFKIPHGKTPPQTFKEGLKTSEMPFI